MRAIVIGGGIAGLTAAIALQQRGWSVMVLEAADSFSEIGAGFGLTPNGVTALGAIGLSEAARAVSWPVTMSGIRSASGRWLLHFDADASYARNLQMFGMRRRDLHALLLDATSDVELLHSVKVREIQPGEPGGSPALVQYELEGTPTTAEADLVVAADGVNSFVRGIGAPATDVRYSGMSSWRGIADDRSLVGSEFAMIWGREADFGALRTGESEVYWYGYVRLPAGTGFGDEKSAAAERFASWASPIPALIEQTPRNRVMRHDVFTLAKPPPRYVHGRTVLVGDAAHAMLPTMGQGVNLALEDAVTLGRLAGAATDTTLDAALEAYERARHRRTAGIHHRSELAGRFGSHLTAPAAMVIRDGLVRLAPPSLSARASRSLFAWKPPG